MSRYAHSRQRAGTQAQEPARPDRSRSASIRCSPRAQAHELLLRLAEASKERRADRAEHPLELATARS